MQSYIKPVRVLAPLVLVGLTGCASMNLVEYPDTAQYPGDPALINTYHNVHYNNPGFYPNGYYNNGGHYYMRGYRY